MTARHWPRIAGAAILAAAGLVASAPSRADHAVEQLIPIQQLVSMPYYGIRCFQNGSIIVQADHLDYVKLWRDGYGNLRRIDFRSGVNAQSSVHIADGTTCVVGPQ